MILFSKSSFFDVFCLKSIESTQRLALFHSVLGTEEEKEDEKDFVDSKVNDADDYFTIHFFL